MDRKWEDLSQTPVEHLTSPSHIQLDAGDEAGKRCSSPFYSNVAVKRVDLQTPEHVTFFVSLCLHGNRSLFQNGEFLFHFAQTVQFWRLCSSTCVFVSVHRGAGPAPRPGGLGQEHVQRDGGGTRPGSGPPGGGNVSSNLERLPLETLKSASRPCVPEARGQGQRLGPVCFPYPAAPAGRS